MSRAGWLAAGAIAAALISLQASREVTLGLAAVALVLATAALGVRNAALAAVALGALAVLARTAMGDESDARAATPLPANTAWVADVESVLAPQQGRQRALVAVWPSDGDAAAAVRAYASLPRYPPVARGDRIAFEARLEAAPRTPGFGDYLAREGISATVEVPRMRLAHASDGPHRGVEAVRRGAGELLARALPQAEAGLAAGVLVGLRDQMTRDVRDAFAASGLSHIVAISGWNIAVVGAVVASMLRGLRRRRRALCVAAAIAVYTVLAGSEPSVVRAALMGGVAILARESGRHGHAGAALGLAAAAMLVAEPATVFEIGFQLSVAATAGLLCWASPLERLLQRRLSRLPRWTVEALAVSLAAQFATLPLVVLHFSTLSLVAPAANLLVAPLVAPAMLVSLLAVVAGALAVAGAGPLAAPLELAAALVLGAVIGIARVCAGLPGATLELAVPLAFVTAGATAVLVLTASPLAASARSRLQEGIARARRNYGSQSSREASRSPPPVVSSASLVRRANEPGRSVRRLPIVVSGGVLAAGALLIGLVAVSRPDGKLHVTVLDVGQGDAILLQGDAGARMLVDTGPDPDRLLALLDARVPAWDRRLDVVAISHPHEDHIAGLALLLERYTVGVIVEPGIDGPGNGDDAYRDALARAGRRSLRLAAGDVVALDGAAIRVLWPRDVPLPPRDPEDGKEINNWSLVFDVRYGDHRIVLTGDVEEEVDPQLLAQGVATGGAVDVLKVSHHGSRTATTGALLDALVPRVAAISVGEQNDYGHPAPETLERLTRAGAVVVRTDVHGTVTVATDGKLLTVSTERNARPAGTASELPPFLQSAGVRPVTIGGRRGPPPARPTTLVSRARLGGRGDRQLPCRPCGGTWAAGSRRPRRDGRAPPRRRQAAAGPR